MDDIFIDQQPIVGTVKDFRPFDIVKVNTKEADQLWDHMVRTWHYLGFQAMIGPRIKYLVLYHDKPVAAVSFTQAALKIGVRDSWIGLDAEHIRKILPHMLNNNRFLILPWVKIKNLASFILSRVLHLLKKDWLETYHCPPYAVETFVDITRYPGTCYKAANWSYVGETMGYGKVRKAYVYHGNRKGVFGGVDVFLDSLHGDGQPFTVLSRAHASQRQLDPFLIIPL